MRLDGTTATCLVFTFKEGMLSAIAHDLKIRVERLEIEIEGLESGSATRVEARFETGSLRVVCAMKDGVEQPGGLSEGDRKKIEQIIREDVLPAKRSTEARFRSTRIEGDRVEGVLALNGVERPLTAQARREAGRATIEVELDQADFGIKPYTAALGTLRVRPKLRVQLSVPLPGLQRCSCGRRVETRRLNVCIRERCDQALLRGLGETRPIEAAKAAFIQSNSTAHVQAPGFNPAACQLRRTTRSVRGEQAGDIGFRTKYPFAYSGIPGGRLESPRAYPGIGDATPN